MHRHLFVRWVGGIAACVALAACGGGGGETRITLRLPPAAHASGGFAPAAGNVLTGETTVPADTSRTLPANVVRFSLDIRHKDGSVEPFDLTEQTAECGDPCEITLTVTAAGEAEFDFQMFAKAASSSAETVAGSGEALMRRNIQNAAIVEGGETEMDVTMWPASGYSDPVSDGAAGSGADVVRIDVIREDTALLIDLFFSGPTRGFSAPSSPDGLLRGQIEFDFSAATGAGATLPGANLGLANATHSLTALPNCERFALTPGVAAGGDTVDCGNATPAESPVTGQDSDANVALLPYTASGNELRIRVPYAALGDGLDPALLRQGSFAGYVAGQNSVDVFGTSGSTPLPVKPQ